MRPRPRQAPGAFAHLQCERSTPLARPTAPYGPALQAAKEQNVRRAAALLDGATLAPGEVFSWHARVGPPFAVRGFAPGPELHGDELRAGGGGGLCQVANLLFWLGLHAGLEVVERHRHGLDLFPDHDRSAPFGCGATVFFPTRDLKLRNPHPVPVCFRLWLAGGRLHGQARLPVELQARWHVEETDHRFTRERDGVWRHNVLWRVRSEGGGEIRERLADHHARVRYDVPDVQLS